MFCKTHSFSLKKNPKIPDIGHWPTYFPEIGRGDTKMGSRNRSLRYMLYMGMYISWTYIWDGIGPGDTSGK
jgi:hypothetical protein